MTRAAAAVVNPASPEATGARVTLLELVAAIGEVTDDEEEITATVRHMLRSGRAKLCGNFRDPPVDCFDA